MMCLFHWTTGHQKIIRCIDYEKCFAALLRWSTSVCQCVNYEKYRNKWNHFRLKRVWHSPSTRPGLHDGERGPIIAGFVLQWCKFFKQICVQIMLMQIPVDCCPTFICNHPHWLIYNRQSTVWLRTYPGHNHLSSWLLIFTANSLYCSSISFIVDVWQSSF